LIDARCIIKFFLRICFRFFLTLMLVTLSEFTFGNFKTFLNYSYSLCVACSLSLSLNNFLSSSSNSQTQWVEYKWQRNVGTKWINEWMEMENAMGCGVWVISDLKKNHQLWARVTTYIYVLLASGVESTTMTKFILMWWIYLSLNCRIFKNTIDFRRERNGNLRKERRERNVYQ